MRKFLLPLAAITFLAPASLVAQVCRGGVAFAPAKMQGQLGLEIETGSSEYVIAGGKGGTRWYGLGSLGVRTYEAREGSTFILGVGGGRMFTNRLTGGARHCLELHGEFGTGPDDPGEVRADESSSNVSLELLSGVPITTGGSLVVTPFAGFAMRYVSVVVQGEETSQAVKDFYEIVTLGVGLTMNDVYALQPYAQFPLGRNGNTDPLFGMRLSLNLGSSGR